MEFVEKTRIRGTNSFSGAPGAAEGGAGAVAAVAGSYFPRRTRTRS
jgi:hypothetical protein